MTRHHTNSFLPLVPQSKPQVTCHQALLTPPLLPRVLTKYLYKCTFSKRLTYNQANLKQLHNQGTLQDITNKKRHYVKPPTISQSSTVLNNQSEQSSKKFAQNNFSPICHENLPSILYGARHNALAPLENYVGLYPSIFERKCRKKLANILNLTKRIVSQNRSMCLRII